MSSVGKIENMPKDIPSGYEIQSESAKWRPTSEQVAKLKPGDVIEGFGAETYFMLDEYENGDEIKRETREEDIIEMIFHNAVRDGVPFSYSKLEVEILKDIFIPCGDDWCYFWRVTI